MVGNSITQCSIADIINKLLNIQPTWDGQQHNEGATVTIAVSVAQAMAK